MAITVEQPSFRVANALRGTVDRPSMRMPMQYAANEPVQLSDEELKALGIDPVEYKRKQAAPATAPAPTTAEPPAQPVADAPTETPEEVPEGGDLFDPRSKAIAADAIRFLQEYYGLDPKDAAMAVSGMELPGEASQRLGAGMDYLKRYRNDLRGKLKRGDVTGIFDRFASGNLDASDAAETYRQLQSGQDVLRRLLSGATLNTGETTEYQQRYLPSYTDDYESVTSKGDDLARAIIYAMKGAVAGRGGDFLLEEIDAGGASNIDLRWLEEAQAADQAPVGPGTTDPEELMRRYIEKRKAR